MLDEAEVLTENGIPQEPGIEKVIIPRKRTKVKRDLNLKGIEVEIPSHACTEEDLQEHFPRGDGMSLKMKSIWHLSTSLPVLKCWNII